MAGGLLCFPLVYAVFGDRNCSLATWKGSAAQWLHLLSDGLCHAASKFARCRRAGFEWHASQAQNRRAMRAGPFHSHGGIGQDSRQFRLQALHQGIAVAGLEPLQYKLVDAQPDAAHAHPRISASEIGRSIFCASILAA